MKIARLIKFSLMSVATITLLTGCGTISGINASKGQTIRNASKYDQIAVMDFSNKTAKKNAGVIFADRIADKLEAKGGFKNVTRNKPEGNALVISGTITRCEDGNATARMWIGLGAGSSYFDADVKFSGNLESSEWGTITVDKNSWVLGGAVAASQDVDYFMNEAADKICEELEKTTTL